MKLQFIFRKCVFDQILMKKGLFEDLIGKVVVRKQFSID